MALPYSFQQTEFSIYFIFDNIKASESKSLYECTRQHINEKKRRSRHLR